MSKENCESEARKKIAASIGATPEEIYFTSGRADGHLKALKAVVKASKKARPHVIITTMEDPEVLDECSRLERKDAVVTYLDPITTGRVEVAMIENELKENTELISVTAAGMTPFASSFAMFAAGRAFEQVRNSVGYPHLNVKIGATHGGISVGEDGATHQCCEDIALMRTIPGMTVIVPSDDIEAKAAVKAAAAMEGPVYMRFGRLAVPVINDEDYKFEIGKGKVLREGTDVAIIANGLCVAESLDAAEKLAAEGINAQVINMATVKPLDTELVLEAAKATGKVVTVEEHSVIGGLGSAVCDVLSEQLPTPVLKIGVNDVFGHSGPAVELIKEFGLDGDSIAAKVKEFVK